MNSKTNTGGLHLLHEERLRLKAECKKSEEKLLIKFEELKEDYPRLLTDAILPFESNTNQTVGDVMGMMNSMLFSKIGPLFKDQKKSQVWLKFGIQIAQMLAIRGVSNWFGKKKKAKEE